MKSASKPPDAAGWITRKMPSPLYYLHDERLEVLDLHDEIGRWRDRLYRGTDWCRTGVDLPTALSERKPPC
jgi:hypothetical protein